MKDKDSIEKDYNRKYDDSMKILMISYDMQDFGGLEEYAVNLAIGLKQQGQVVSYMSMAWVNPENQYSHRLKDAGIPIVQSYKRTNPPQRDAGP